MAGSFPVSLLLPLLQLLYYLRRLRACFCSYWCHCPHGAGELCPVSGVSLVEVPLWPYAGSLCCLSVGGPILAMALMSPQLPPSFMARSGTPAGGRGALWCYPLPVCFPVLPDPEQDPAGKVWLDGLFLLFCRGYIFTGGISVADIPPLVVFLSQLLKGKPAACPVGLSRACPVCPYAPMICPFLYRICPLCPLFVP